MNRFFLIGLFFGISFFYSGESKAQLISVKSAEDIHEDLLFNIDFIRNNKIKMISGQYMVKKDYQPLANYGEKVKYRFDEKGRLVEKFIVKRVGMLWDTISATYIYDINNQLLEEKTKKGNGFWLKEYLFKEGETHSSEVVNYLVTQKSSFRDTIRLHSQQMVWNLENDSISEVEISNNYGRPYIRVTKFYDRTSTFLKHESYYYIVTGQKEEVRYHYNKMGWIDEIDDKGEKYLFQYDELGNVIEVNQESNKVQVKHVEYLYKANGLLEAKLRTEEGSSTVHIVKYSIAKFE